MPRLTRITAANSSTVSRSGSSSYATPFSADELVALSRGFDLPVGWFFTPPPAAQDVGLATPDAKVNGLDPVVLLDAVLGTPANLSAWEQAVGEYAAGAAPEPHRDRWEPNRRPEGLRRRLEAFGGIRAKALLRQAFGGVDEARAVLERLVEVLRVLDEGAPQASEGQEQEQASPPASARSGATR